jgi:hypothetical protein
MTAAPPQEEKKPEGKIAGLFGAMVGFPGRMLRWSLAARAALVMAIFLLGVVIVAWTIFLVDPQSVPPSHSLSWGRVLAVVVLLILIPLVVYRCLKLFLEGETSQFPDIDYAWKAGLTALARNGLSLESAPIYLILGSSGDVQERGMAEASGLNFRVQGVPDGPAPLHWYAHADGIYLFCTDASWLSALSALEGRRELQAVAATLPNREAPSLGPPPGSVAAASAPAGMTPAAPRLGGEAPAAAAAAARGGAEAIRGTVMLSQFEAQQPLSRPAAPVPAPARGEGSVRGTLLLQALPGQGELAGAASEAAAYSSQGAIERQASLLAPQDSAEQLQRLQYVGQLLARTRQPLVPVNGILTLLPLAAIQGGARDAQELQRAVRADLTTLQRTLAVRCPVTALVTGMEEEPGFRELVRRVGRERAAVQRFGRGFDVRTQPTGEALSALCEHVCGAFEDWVYSLFRETGVLTRPGNARLYHLLCKVRCYLKAPLGEILTGGYAYDPQLHAADEPLLFSGCYFAATGSAEDRQAFVRGVFDKLADEQEDVEWTARALRNERRYLTAAYVGFTIDLALAAALAGMIVTRTWLR